jgi:hypothetical protein
MPVFTRRNILGMAAGSLSLPHGAAQPPGGDARAMESAFATPPDSAKPWVYWFWLNGNLSREGATADLEAMKQAGIAGVLIMSIGGGADPGPIRFLTPEWRDLVKHVMAEADRLGLVVDMNNDDGWDCGGPWIKPEDAMQKMVWSEHRLRGPRSFSGALPQPEIKLGFYRDAAVLAFPTPAGEAAGSALAGAKRTASQGEYVQLEFPQPFTAHALVVTSEERKIPMPQCELQVSDDGARFRSVCRFETGWETVLAAYNSITVAISETTARYYRLLAPGINPKNKAALRFGFDPLGAARLHFWEMKAGFINQREHGGGAYLFLERNRPALASGAAIPRSGVIDLTGRMDPSGRLQWQVPEGDWTVLRIGHTATGALNGFATPEGSGLDCDKLARAGVEAHVRGMMTTVLEDSKALVGKSLKYFHNDSWESGCQNWTPALREEFKKRRGYDLLPYLPVMAGGRVVDSPEVAERFLWDLRRTLADLMAENYWGHFGKLCHDRGLIYSVESAGRQQFLYDPINLLSKGDVPMGEFWSNELWTRPDCKLASSTAHGYGKRVVGAEAYTTGLGPNAQWQAHPFSLKAQGDHAFCVGVNHFVFHRYLHQMYKDRKPGVTWAHIGINLERTQTWWRQGAAWMSYLARCQNMLQRGVAVCDLAYFTGEGVPNAMIRRNGKDGAPPARVDGSTFTELSLRRHEALPPAPPFGYDFDGCNTELIMRMSVRDGKLVLPGGAVYRALVLPAGRTMTPALLAKLKELVQAGATVVGEKPSASPSLTDYPACDEQVRRLAGEVWDDGPGSRKAVAGKPLSAVLEGLGVPPDFAYQGTDGADLDFVHRRDGATEIYFVANRRDRAEDAECTFRVSGKAPELWRPDTGEIARLAAYVQKDGRTTVPLHLDPYGSVFVVFRGRSSASPVVSVKRDGRPLHVAVTAAPRGKVRLDAWEAGAYELATASGKVLRTSVAAPAARTVSGPWEVRFPAGWGAPGKIVLDDLMSWSKHPEDGVRYFSGTATYARELEIPAELIGGDRLLHLDLGKVMVIAEVSVNGKDLGVLWKPPFRVSLAGAVRAGRNVLEVKVTNLWPNRMIGDQFLPEGKRYTWTTWTPYTKQSPLLESGLLGPVKIVGGRKILL